MLPWHTCLKIVLAPLREASALIPLLDHTMPGQSFMISKLLLGVICSSVCMKGRSRNCIRKEWENWIETHKFFIQAFWRVSFNNCTVVTTFPNRKHQHTSFCLLLSNWNVSLLCHITLLSFILFHLCLDCEKIDVLEPWHQVKLQSPRVTSQSCLGFHCNFLHEI